MHSTKRTFTVLITNAHAWFMK